MREGGREGGREGEREGGGREGGREEGRGSPEHTVSSARTMMNDIYSIKPRF